MNMERYITAEMPENTVTQAINCIAWAVRKYGGELVKAKSLGEMHMPIERRVYTIPLGGHLEVEAEYSRGSKISLKFMGDHSYSENILSRLTRLGFSVSRDFQETGEVLA